MYDAGSGLTNWCVWSVSTPMPNYSFPCLVLYDRTQQTTTAVFEWVSSDRYIEYGVTRWHLTNKAIIGQCCSGIGSEMQ